MLSNCLIYFTSCEKLLCGDNSREERFVLARCFRGITVQNDEEGATRRAPISKLGVKPTCWLDFIVNLADEKVTWEELSSMDCPVLINLPCLWELS